MASLIPLVDFINTFSEISDNYTAVICDLWGCLHDGINSFPAALSALEEFKASSGKVILVTNAPRPIKNVEYQIENLGIRKIHYDMLLTSGELTSKYVNKICKSKLSIFHIGGKRHHSIFKNMIDEKKISIEIENIVNTDLIVCTEPFDPSRDRLSDYDNILRAGIEKNLTFLCANPDLVVDVGDTREMCAGSLASMYEKLGGKVIYFGKPHNNIYQEVYSFLNIGDKAKEHSILCIGDGLTTDIRGANNEKLDSLLVIGGLLKRSHLMGKGDRTIIDKTKLNQTINKNEVHVNYVIKFFE
ncbi:TIGR01459 family HAD-type hydrolase [Paracoccaceae bacterium]|nr:TIGR01459 family HAD-type hydrolase [Paracoccaceae bacterium]